MKPPNLINLLRRPMLKEIGGDPSWAHEKRSRKKNSTHFNVIQLPLDPKTWKNDGFKPQNMGYNEGCGFP